MIADAGYKTPGIVKLLIDNGIKPLMPYRRPMTKEGFESLEPQKKTMDSAIRRCLEKPGWK